MYLGNSAPYLDCRDVPLNFHLAVIRVPTVAQCGQAFERGQTLDRRGIDFSGSCHVWSGPRFDNVIGIFWPVAWGILVPYTDPLNFLWASSRLTNPMGLETLHSEAAVKASMNALPVGFAWSREVERDATLLPELHACSSADHPERSESCH